MNDILYSPGTVGRYLQLQRLLHNLQNGRDWLSPQQLAPRLDALDELDAIIGDLDGCALDVLAEPELVAHAMALRSQFEAANQIIYESTRAEIAVLRNPSAMNHWMQKLVSGGDADKPRPGLSFDVLDDFVNGVLPLRRPEASTFIPSPEMTPYQPTPVRHILDVITACNFSKDDVLIDLGSGLGHVPMLVSILTGISTVGIEVQPSYVASAQETARGLNLNRVRFAAEDARIADLSSGTVFYLFSPFRGSILTDVVRQLHKQSQERSIKVCSLGPCTRVLQGETWLTGPERKQTDRIVIFNSLQPSHQYAHLRRRLLGTECRLV